MIDQKPMITSPLKPCVPIDGEKINLGRKLANSSRKWMEDNEEGFREIYQFVKSLQASHTCGRLHDRVTIHCMKRHIRVSDKPEIKFSNDLWTSIARYLVVCDPSLMDAPVKLRPSAIDHVGLWRISWMEDTCSQRR